MITGAGGQRDISTETAAAIRNLPYIRKGVDGEPLVMVESGVPLEAKRRGTDARIYFPLSGVTSNVVDMQPEMRLSDGRLFKRGLHELTVSNACVREYKNFETGARRAMHGGDWVIVGHVEFDNPQQCIAYADVDSVNAAFRRNSYDRAVVMLTGPDDFDGLRSAALALPTVRLDIKREREAVEESFKSLNGLLNFVSYFVGAVMALGATLGAINSLYATVDARRRELATLRAIGFMPGPIVVSIVLESVALAIPGALLGCALGWTFFNGFAASPFGFSFQLAVTLDLAAIGVAWAVVMGTVGGLLPALRAARVPVTAALRAT